MCLGVSCECHNLHDGRFEGRTDEQEDSAWLKQSIMNTLQDREMLESLAYVWLDVVSEFSRLRLTKESDRMAAVTGIASKFSGTALGPFIAGIWEGDLARDLLYERAIGQENDKSGEDLKLMRNSQPS